MGRHSNQHRRGHNPPWLQQEGRNHGNRQRGNYSPAVAQWTNEPVLLKIINRVCQFSDGSAFSLPVDVESFSRPVQPTTPASGADRYRPRHGGYVIALLHFRNKRSGELHVIPVRENQLAAKTTVMRAIESVL